MSTVSVRNFEAGMFEMVLLVLSHTQEQFCCWIRKRVYESKEGRGLVSNLMTLYPSICVCALTWWDGLIKMMATFGLCLAILLLWCLYISIAVSSIANKIAGIENEVHCRKPDPRDTWYMEIIFKGKKHLKQCPGTWNCTRIAYACAFWREKTSLVFALCLLAYLAMKVLHK